VLQDLRRGLILQGMCSSYHEVITTEPVASFQLTTCRAMHNDIVTHEL